VNNKNEVIARQSRTNAGAYLSKKGTSIDEVNVKLQEIMSIKDTSKRLTLIKKISKELTVTFSVIFQW
jgi:hypothetical protein